MKILITGGSGFIGKNLVESLSRKYDIDAPAHSDLDFLDVVHTAGMGKNIRPTIRS